MIAYSQDTVHAHLGLDALVLKSEHIRGWATRIYGGWRVPWIKDGLGCRCFSTSSYFVERFSEKWHDDCNRGRWSESSVEVEHWAIQKTSWVMLYGNQIWFILVFVTPIAMVSPSHHYQEEQVVLFPMKGNKRRNTRDTGKFPIFQRQEKQVRGCMYLGNSAKEIDMFLLWDSSSRRRL